MKLLAWMAALFFVSNISLADDFSQGKAIFQNGGSDLQDVRFDQNVGRNLWSDFGVPSLARLNVHDEMGSTHTLKSYFQGRPVIFAMAYYRCPNLCTLILNGLANSLEPMVSGLGRDYDVITLSIDPNEKPSLARAKKRSYLARLGLTEDQPNAHWNFLTADKTAIAQIADAIGFHFKLDEQSHEYLHPSGFAVLTPNGTISQYFFGIKFDSKKVGQALSLARHEEKGSWARQVLLYCFHYDPLLSKNGPRIMATIRIVGGVGAFGLFFLIGTLFVVKPRRRVA